MRQCIYSTNTYWKHSMCETPSLVLLIQYCLQGAGSGREMLLLTFSSVLNWKHSFFCFYISRRKLINGRAKLKKACGLWCYLSLNLIPDFGTYCLAEFGNVSLRSHNFNGKKYPIGLFLVWSDVYENIRHTVNLNSFLFRFS